MRALTLASRDFLTQPPVGFSAGPLLTPRGALFVATAGQRARLDAHWAVLQSLSQRDAAPARRLSAAEALLQVPVLRPGLLIGAVYESDAQEIGRAHV